MGIAAPDDGVTGSPSLHGSVLSPGCGVISLGIACTAVSPGAGAAAGGWELWLCPLSACRALNPVVPPAELTARAAARAPTAFLGKSGCEGAAGGAGLHLWATASERKLSPG